MNGEPVKALSVAELHALIQLEPLEPGLSTNIHAIGYSAELKLMAVQFTRKRDGEFVPAAVYHYQNVTQEEFDGFKNSKSPTSYFNQSFKADPGRWPYVRLPDLPKDDAAN